MRQHEIHDGYCYTHQVWLTRPGELARHILGTEPQAPCETCGRPLAEHRLYREEAER